tara:strand:- start:485 stop:607 length:123 start_codon:yes stop_codon:yes gene_type:complete
MGGEATQVEARAKTVVAKSLPGHQKKGITTIPFFISYLLA